MCYNILYIYSIGLFFLWFFESLSLELGLVGFWALVFSKYIRGGIPEFVKPHFFLYMCLVIDVSLGNFIILKTQLV